MLRSVWKMENAVKPKIAHFKENIRMDRNSVFWILAVFVIYVAIRAIAWHRTILLEDTDSLTYLSNIKLFLSFSLRDIINMDPDSTPFFPFFGALFSLPGWNVEIGARLCSLFFSALLFWSVMGIGRRIASNGEVILGLIILSFSPELISLSFSVLTEPSYIGMVYLGFWFFCLTYHNPKIWHAALLGGIFGLSFLNRLEGLLYIAILPFLMGAAIFFSQDGDMVSRFRRLAAWTLLYVTCFSLVAAPQVWRVSQKMGRFALNGRQVWSAVLKYPDGKSDIEKIFGLDYSPSTNNIKYLKEHPEKLRQYDITPRPADYIKLVARNFDNFYTRGLGILIGPLCLIFFGVGVLAIYQRGLRFEVFLMVSFIAFNLVAPFLHNVVIRHIAVIAPIMLLIAGIGIMHVSQVLLQGIRQNRLRAKVISAVFLAAVIGAQAMPLRAALSPPHENADYSLGEMKKPLAVIKAIELNELKRPPNITAQRKYISYFAEGNHFYLPFADIEKLVDYCCLNDIDFVYLKHSRVQKYPFYKSFLDNFPPVGFHLLYSGLDSRGGRIELFRFQKEGCPSWMQDESRHQK